MNGLRNTKMSSIWTDKGPERHIKLGFISKEICQTDISGNFHLSALFTVYNAGSYALLKTITI